MSVYLKKSFFSRNKEREEAYGSMFNKASLSITFIINVVIATLFAPVVILTSIAFKDVALMLANIFLSVGYSTNFFYRLASKEVSASELIISAITLAAFLVFTFYFLPVTTVWSLVNIINFCNHVATAVNGFFLVRNVIVPPLKKLSESVARFFGYEIGGSYFYQRPLRLGKDRFVIDKLFRKYYRHDVTQSKNFDEELRPFNNLLLKLVSYTDKYNEPFLGSLSNGEMISAHEKLIKQLIIEGNASNCILRIEQKMEYKKTKITLLESAKMEVETITASDSIKDITSKLRFFGAIPSKKVKTARAELKNECLDIIDTELKRQQEKLEALKACLPSTISI